MTVTVFDATYDANPQLLSALLTAVPLSTLRLTFPVGVPAVELTVTVTLPLAL